MLAGPEDLPGDDGGVDPRGLRTGEGMGGSATVSLPPHIQTGEADDAELCREWDPGESDGCPLGLLACGALPMELRPPNV